MSSTCIIWIGMDVHKDTVMVAVFKDRQTEPDVVQQLPNDSRKLRRFFERWASRGEIRSCYEASGAGYVLHREITEWGFACEVIAPSLIPVRPGERRKHDRRDAMQLARLYRAGELTPICSCSRSCITAHRKPTSSRATATTEATVLREAA